jgi:hypothetical protein
MDHSSSPFHPEHFYPYCENGLVLYRHGRDSEILSQEFQFIYQE